MSCYEITDIIFSIVIIIISLSIAICIPIRIHINQIYSDLLNEYRSTEFGLAIIEFKNFINENKKDIISKYISSYKTKKFRNTIHLYRRKISQFYQQLSSLRQRNFFSLREKDLKKDFSKSDLKILREIIRIEKCAIPIILGQTKENDLNINVQNLEKLYKESIKW